MNVILIASLYSDSLLKGEFQYFYMFWWFKLTNVFSKAPPLAAATWLQWLRCNPSGRLQLSTLRPSVWFWRRLAAEVVIHYRNTSLAQAEVSRETTVETWAGSRTLDFARSNCQQEFIFKSRPMIWPFLTILMRQRTAHWARFPSEAPPRAAAGWGDQLERFRNIIYTQCWGDVNYM